MPKRIDYERICRPVESEPLTPKPGRIHSTFERDYFVPWWDRWKAGTGLPVPEKMCTNAQHGHSGSRPYLPGNNKNLKRRG